MMDSTIKLTTTLETNTCRKHDGLTMEPSDDIKKINTHVKCDSGVDVGDVNLVFASNEAIYKECTIPLSELDNNQQNNDTHISIDLAKSDSKTLLSNTAEDGSSSHFISESGKLMMNDDQDRDGLCEISLKPAAAAASGRSTIQGDMMQSINNLRLNMNQHILGGSKNVIGRMRKLSMNELNRHRSSQGRKYKVAFYVCLAALCILFLYLIYQNLFNDR